MHKSKTIFISITRAAAVRSFLRSDFLTELLHDEQIHIVLVLVHKVHDYFREEFNHPRISIEQVETEKGKKWQRGVAQIFNSLVYSKAEYKHLKYGSMSGTRKRNPLLLFWCKHAFFTIISKIVFLRRVARFIERNVFIDHSMAPLFDKYEPDLVFCTTIYATLDISLIKEAYYRKITTISTPKSWDTVGRMFFRFPSEKIIVANQWMKDWIAEEQLISPDNIYVTGLIQFDFYAKKESFLTKEEFCTQCGLDANKPIILYAPQGLLTGDDEQYINELLKDGTFLKKYNLIIRPHFTDITEKRYDHFKTYNGIYIDDEHLRITNMFPGSWDPTPDDAYWQAEVLHASDVVVCFMSTMVLDAHIFDKPVVLLYYEAEGIKREVPIELLYTYPHFEAIIEEKSLKIAYSREELLKYIETYLNDPTLQKEERAKVVEKFTGKVDGGAGKRTAKIVTEYL